MSGCIVVLAVVNPTPNSYRLEVMVENLRRAFESLTQLLEMGSTFESSVLVCHGCSGEWAMSETSAGAWEEDATFWL